ncbi:hypothetical protein niasHT_014907 [Heterodera trifolii]|uniref:Uncharacterized protein n=1 Tax=Heterodera trifolii TaxID=157864 RepID=A0ABD2LFP9_9BILA
MRHTSRHYELPFKDAAIINKIYCSESCKDIENKCQYGGYPHPNHCNQCLCPEGYGMENAKVMGQLKLKPIGKFERSSQS